MKHTPKESVNMILDQAIARAESQLELHKKNLVDMKEQNKLLEKQGRKPRPPETMEDQVNFYTEQIKELKARKK